MPSGKTHTKINLFLWVISLFLFIKYYSILTPIFTIGTWHNYISPSILVGVWFFLFSVDMYIHTIYINPDLDTYSEATKKLWILGWLINLLFKHRGLLHSVIFWGIIFIPLCLFVGTFFIGGFLGILGHLISDWISTGCKRLKYKFSYRNLKRKIRKAF